MLNKIKNIVIISLATMSILAMDEKQISNKINQEKALAFLPVLPTLTHLIAQYATDGWCFHTTEKAHYNILDQLSITADGCLLLSGSYDGTSKVWDTVSGKLKYYRPDNGNGWSKKIFDYENAKTYNRQTFCATSNRHLKTVMIDYEYNGTGIGQLTYGQEVMDIYLTQNCNINSVTFSSDSKYLAIGTNKMLNIFNVDFNQSDETSDTYDGNIDQILPKLTLDYKSDIRSIVPYKSNNFIASTENGLYLFSAFNNEKLDNQIDFQPTLINNIVANKLAISNNNKYLAFTHENINRMQFVSIMDLESKTIIQTLEQNHNITSIALSNDGQYLAIGLSPIVKAMDDSNQRSEQDEFDKQATSKKFNTLRLWDNILNEYTQDFSWADIDNMLKSPVCYPPINPGYKIVRSIIFSPTNNDIFVGLQNGHLLHFKKVSSPDNVNNSSSSTLSNSSSSRQ